MKKFLALALLPMAAAGYAQTANYNAGTDSAILDPDPVTTVTTTRATAVGEAAQAGNRSTATGYDSYAVDRSVAVGVTNSASTVSVAIGNDASANDRSVAIGGSGATATDRSVAVGVNSTASGQSIAVGNQSSSSNGSVVVGIGASASGLNSVAIGNGSTTTRDSTVSVGSVGAERTISNVAPGVFDTDAATMGQMRQVEREMSKGIAAAIALSNVITPSAPGKISVSIGGGFFNGESAAGLNAAYAVPAWGANRGVVGLGIATSSGYASGTTGKVFAGFEF